MRILSNILKWIFPFIFAIIIWLLLVTENEYTIIVETPIEIYEPRSDKVLKNEIPSSAQVLFRGKGKNLMVVKYLDPPKLILDVTTINRRYNINLNEYFSKYPNRVVYPQNKIEFLEIIYPESIFVAIDDKLSKLVPISIKSKISTQPGYIMTQDINSEPQEIEIIGPKTLIRKIKSIETEEIILSNLSQRFTEKVTLINPDKSFITLNNKTVNIHGVVESIGEKIINNIPVKVINMPENLTVRLVPAMVSLKIIGGNDQIQSVNSDDISIKFNYATGYVSGKNFYEPDVLIPENVLEWQKMTPSKIEVIIARK